MAKPKPWNFIDHSNISYREKEDLNDFLSFFEGACDRAKELYPDCKDGKDLHLPNLMAVACWAVQAFPAHKDRIKYKNYETELHNEFIKKHPEGDFCAELMVRCGWDENPEMGLDWFSYGTLRTKILLAGAKSVDDAMSIKPEDFRKLKGVGPELVEELKQAQERYAAHAEIAAQYPGMIEFMRKHYDMAVA